MLISREEIDASIDTRNAIRDAHYSAMFDQIVKNIPALDELTRYMYDIEDTNMYLKIRDNDASSAFWRDINLLTDKFRLDFYNAINYKDSKRWGIGADGHGYQYFYRNLFVLDDGVIFSRPNDGDNRYVLSEDNLRSILRPEDYEVFLKTMLHLINSIPAYCDALSSALKDILSNLK